MTTEYKTPTLTLRVHDNFVLALANNYVTISEREIDFLGSVTNKHFSGPFGVIEVRDKNIAIDPGVHRKAKRSLPNYTAYALVTNDIKTMQNFSQEESEMRYAHHKLCNSIDEAQQWMAGVLAAANALQQTA